MEKTLSPLLRFMQAKVRSYQGKSDTPFVTGIQDVLKTLGNDVSPEFSLLLINLVCESNAQTHVLKRAVIKNRN